MSHTCPSGERCCNGEGERVWFENFSSLFCKLTPIPYGSLSSGERINAITRFVLYLTSVMITIDYKYTKTFFMLGILFIFLIYVVTKEKKEVRNEKFRFLSDDNVNNQMSQKNFANVQLMNNPQFPNSENYLFKSKVAELPAYSNNINNNYKGESMRILKARNLNFEHGNRDSTADIQYFKTKQGVNRKAMINPVIEPRILDQSVWGKSSIVRDGVNSRYVTDITDSDLDFGQNFNRPPRDPYGIGTPINYRNRVDGGVMEMNNIQDKYDPTVYGAQQLWYGNEDYGDYKENVIPQYSNFLNGGLQLEKTKDVPSEVVNIQKDKVKEKFDFVNLDSPSVVNEQYGNMGKVQRFNDQYRNTNRTPLSSIQGVTPITNQLIPESPSYVYTDDYFKQPSTRTYLQDIQPKMYSYAVDQTPINSNIGISYSPQIAPRFMDQIVDANKRNYPLMTRIDPQLVRDDGTPAQIQMNPVRSDWSAKYSDYEAPQGSINFEDVYDPRYSSYGDPYRSYSDINLGQTRYYYGDVDAYRMPNFIQRSNVDFVEYRTPQNQVWSEYNRTASLDDVKATVESQTTADELFHREDMMEHLMSKRNRESWQLKNAPISRAARSNMPFGPT